MSGSRAAPPIAVLGCMHACRGARLDGLVSLPCAGRLDLASLLLVFARGGAGALVLACPADRCLHRGGADAPCVHPAARVVALGRDVLSRAGLSPARIALRHLVPGEPLEPLVEAHREAVARIGEWRARPLEVRASDRLSPVERALLLVAAIEAQAAGPDTAPAAGAVLLWPGCVALRAELAGAGPWPEVGGELVRRAGSTQVEAPSRCCGLPLLASGAPEAFAVLARSNAEAIARSGAREVVTACGHCAATMRDEYAAVGAPFDVPVTDLASWAVGRVALRGDGRVAVAGPEGGAELSAALGALAAGPVLAFPECDAGLAGPDLRGAVLGLVEAAAERDAHAAVLTCAHGAALVRAVLAPGSWRGAPSVPVLGAPEALLWLSEDAASAPDQGSGDGRRHGH